MIELDGAEGEGGGQILRTSLALSLVTGQGFHLRNLRAGRSKPGLHPQHLASVNAAAEIGQAKTRGASLNSTDLVFEPGEVRPGDYHFRVGTAGATALVLQTIYVPLALASAASTVKIEGGTHVRAAPCYHFLETTWAAYLCHVGLHVRLKMHRPGFYPRGGGLIEATILPWTERSPLNLDRLDQAERIRAFSAVAGLPVHVQRRQAERMSERLAPLKVDVTMREERWDGGPGSVAGIELLTAPAPTLFVGLGERGKPSERVADEAVDQVLAFLAAEPLGVDEHSADQLVLPLALVPEPSRFAVANVSSHLLTNIAVIRRFVEREITVAGISGGPGVVSVV